MLSSSTSCNAFVIKARDGLRVFRNQRDLVELPTWHIGG